MLAAGVVLCDDDGPRLGPDGIELGLAFLTADDFIVDECWDMDGLRGTGSHDVLADLDIDADRVSSLWADKWPAESLYRLRTFDVLGPALAMVPLAIGRAALDTLRVKTQADAGRRAERRDRGPDSPTTPSPSCVSGRPRSRCVPPARCCSISSIRRWMPPTSATSRRARRAR